MAKHWTRLTVEPVAHGFVVHQKVSWTADEGAVECHCDGPVCSVGLSLAGMFFKDRAEAEDCVRAARR